MDTMREILELALPDSFDPSQYFMNILIAVISVLIVGSVFRLCFGKGSILNSAISSAIAIACLYVMGAVAYSFNSHLDMLFAPLPYVSVKDNYLYIFNIFDASFSRICQEITNLVALSYLMNLLESWLPKGSKLWSWYGFRALSLILALCLHHCLNIFLNAVLPERFWELAPMILLTLILTAFFLGLLKIMVGGALSFIHPFLGLFYTFFFTNNAGKQLMRALITTLILTVLVCVLNYLDYTAIYIASTAIITYMPIIFLGLLLWYIIAQLL